jgi:hypothetical protein
LTSSTSSEDKLTNNSKQSSKINLPTKIIQELPSETAVSIDSDNSIPKEENSAEDHAEDSQNIPAESNASDSTIDGTEDPSQNEKQENAGNIFWYITKWIII